MDGQPAESVDCRRENGSRGELKEQRQRLAVKASVITMPSITLPD